MDKLELNLEDVRNREVFLKKLQNWLNSEGVTANGIFRTDVNPETDEDNGRVKIMNNAPALPGKEVKYGGNSNSIFFDGLSGFEP